MKNFTDVQLFGHCNCYYVAMKARTFKKNRICYMIRKETVGMKNMYFTITGCEHYLGNEFMEKGMKVKLKKEPDNEFDSEAIMVKIKGIGKCGYVANSPFTVKGESLSAGRLYDRIGKIAKGKIIAVIDGGAICKVVEDGIK